jgi:hypothetical protein
LQQSPVQWHSPMQQHVIGARRLAFASGTPRTPTTCVTAISSASTMRNGYASDIS